MSAERRSANFFRGTRRDQHIAYDALEMQALRVVHESIVARAQSMRRNLSPSDLNQMLSAAQSQLRGLSPEDLRGISPSSAILKTITDASFSAVLVNDPRANAARLAGAANDPTSSVEGGGTFAARMLRLDFERENRAASSNRYEGMGGNERLSQADLQNVAAARSLARDLGMPWVANNPELLRLGPTAIKTLHEAGVQRERFERMTGDKVGFRAATAVDIAAFAKRHNLSPEQTNQLFDRVSDGVQVISGGNRAIQRELDEATRQFVTDPQAPNAKERLEAAYNRHADTPEKRKAAERTTKALEEAAQRNAVVIQRVDVSQAREGAAVAANSAGLDDPPVKRGGHASAPSATAPPATLAAPAVPAANKPPAPK